MPIVKVLAFLQSKEANGYIGRDQYFLDASFYPPSQGKNSFITDNFGVKKGSRHIHARVYMT